MCGFFMEKLIDAIRGIPYVNIIGTSEMSVENFCGILEYGTELIRVLTKTGKIIIKGQNLSIEYYTNDEMNVRGNIAEIEDVQGGVG